MKLNVVIFRTALLCLALVATLGCRRTLHDNPPTPPTPPAPAGTVPVELVFDWSKSGLTQAQMKRASARIFPEAGGEPIEVILTGNLDKTTVHLAPGAYRAVGINGTSSAGDWNGIDFSGLARCDDFSASMRLLSKGRAADVMVGGGDHLAVAPVKRFEVAEQTAEQKPQTITFVPAPVTQQIRVIARIQNLDNARSFTAALSGMYATQSLWSGVYSEQRAVHHFDLNNRIYDIADKHNGTIEAKFYVFKLVEGEEFTKKLSLIAKLLDGSTYNQEFEVTRRIEKGELIYELKVGVRPNEDDIILPVVPDEYVSVSFNLDWNLSYLSPIDKSVASIWIYPTAAGEAPIELPAYSNTVSTMLKAGRYSVVAFNKSTKFSDWTGLDIVDEASYDMISGRVRSFTGAKDVDPLAGAVLGELTVVEKTPKTETLVFKPVTSLVDVKVNIKNLDNAKTVSCSLENMASGALFFSGAEVGLANYLFDLTDRNYDPLDRRNGAIQGKLYIFGNPTVPVPQRILKLNCTLLDGTVVENQPIDVGSLFTTVTSGYHYKLEVGPITITERPRLPIDGDPSVGGWPGTDTNHPLK